MTERKSIPHIRFKEFEEEWKTKKLEEITEIAMGQSPSSKNYLNSEIKDSYVLIQGNADIKNNKVVPRVWTTQATKLSNPGDIILTVRAPVGELARNKFQAVIGRGVSAFKGNDFLFYYLQKLNIEGYWQHLSAGSTFESISSKDIASTATELTSIAEQQKIGGLFSKLDQLLDLQQQKLDQLELLKKVLLQKLFPKQGAKIPELRFKGFEEEWKKEKLGNIITWNKGKELSKKYLNLNKAGTPVIHYADLYKFAEVTSKTIHWSTYNQGNAIPSNSILFPSSDVTPTGLARTTAVTCVGIRAGGDVIIGVLNKKVYNVFMSYQINKNHKQILRLVSGTSIKHVNSHDLSRLYEYITDYNEQQKIGVLLAKIDRLIELENKKFSNLKLVKKSLLQNMFVE